MNPMKDQLLFIIIFYFAGPPSAQLSDSVRFAFEYSGTGIINNTDISHSFIFRNAPGADVKWISFSASVIIIKSTG